MEWISFEERKPLNYQACWVFTFYNEYILLARFISEGDGSNSFFRFEEFLITHTPCGDNSWADKRVAYWMPIEEPPSPEWDRSSYPTDPKASIKFMIKK